MHAHLLEPWTLRLRVLPLLTHGRHAGLGACQHQPDGRPLRLPHCTPQAPASAAGAAAAGQLSHARLSTDCLLPMSTSPLGW